MDGGNLKLFLLLLGHHPLPLFIVLFYCSVLPSVIVICYLFISLFGVCSVMFIFLLSLVWIWFKWLLLLFIVGMYSQFVYLPIVLPIGSLYNYSSTYLLFFVVNIL